MGEGKIYVCAEAKGKGIGAFGESLRMEVLDYLGESKPVLYVTVFDGPGNDDETREIVLRHADARRVLRACLDALEAKE